MQRAKELLQHKKYMSAGMRILIFVQAHLLLNSVFKTVVSVLAGPLGRAETNLRTVALQVCVATSNHSATLFSHRASAGALMRDIILETEEGKRDIDRDPLLFTLSRTSCQISSSVFSRLREHNASSGTVLG